MAESRLYGGRDLIHWGPVWAGIVGAFGTMILFGTLGLAIGLAAFDPGTSPGQLSTASAAWGAFVLALSFFVGGWLAGRTSSYRTNFSGFLQGSIVWALGLSITLLLMGMGLGAFLGAAASFFQGISPSGINTQVAPSQVATMTQSAALWTFVALLLAWVLSVAGAFVGARSALHDDVSAA